jgi:hypothetical protein
MKRLLLKMKMKILSVSYRVPDHISTASKTVHFTRTQPLSISNSSGQHQKGLKNRKLLRLRVLEPTLLKVVSTKKYKGAYLVAYLPWG